MCGSGLCLHAFLLDFYKISGDIHTVRDRDDHVSQKCLFLGVRDAEIFLGTVLESEYVGEHVFQLAAKIVVCHGDGVKLALHIKQLDDAFKRKYVFCDGDEDQVNDLIGAVLLFLRRRNDSFLDVIADH